MALPGTSFRLTLAPPDGTLNPIDQIIEEVANQPPPAPKGKQVLWTPALCSKLYEAVRDEKAFMDEVGKGKDKTKTKEYKWKKITASLAEDPAFASFLPLSADQLKKKFVREIDRVSQKYALEKEGSNLSGLTEKDITEPLELMLYGMKIKELKYGRERETTKAKDKKRQADMLKHEVRQMHTVVSCWRGTRMRILSSLGMLGADSTQQTHQRLLAPPPMKNSSGTRCKLSSLLSSRAKRCSSCSSKRKRWTSKRRKQRWKIKER